MALEAVQKIIDAQNADKTAREAAAKEAETLRKAN
jgi:hypothetical protein